MKHADINWPMQIGTSLKVQKEVAKREKERLRLQEKQRKANLEKMRLEQDQVASAGDVSVLGACTRQ